jgi:hypothetical protein
MPMRSRHASSHRGVGEHCSRHRGHTRGLRRSVTSCTRGRRWEGRASDGARLWRLDRGGKVLSARCLSLSRCGRVRDSAASDVPFPRRATGRHHCGCYLTEVRIGNIVEQRLRRLLVTSGRRTLRGLQGREHRGDGEPEGVREADEVQHGQVAVALLNVTDIGVSEPGAGREGPE